MSALFTLDLEGNLTRVTDFVFGLQSQWSHDGSHVLISVYDTAGVVQLVVYAPDTKTETPVTTGVRAGECAWSIGRKHIVCGVDDTAPFEPGDITAQRIEKISLQPLVRDVLVPSGTRKISVKEVLLSPLEDSILFLNAFDQKAYSLKIK